MIKFKKFFAGNKEYAPLALRLVAAWRLIAGVYTYAFFSKPITEVKGFFQHLGIPFPLASAYISVYAQLVCGVLFAIGLWIRPAALLMIINFVIAILAAHLNDAITTSFAAWALLAISISLLFIGAGKISIDNFRRKNLPS